jgi:hypothetical protein
LASSLLDRETPPVAADGASHKEEKMQRKTSIPPPADTDNTIPSSGNGAEDPFNKPLLDDPFDLARLRLPQDFENMVGVKKALLTVPVRKPRAQEFIRVHSDQQYRFNAALLEVKDDRENYLVNPSLLPDVREARAKTLFTTITRQGVVFLWPVSLPSSDGRLDSWNRAAFEHAQLAMKEWITLIANMALGAHEASIATTKWPEPDWPEEDFQTLLRIAFKDRFIQSLDHPVLRRLRGEV